MYIQFTSMPVGRSFATRFWTEGSVPTSWHEATVATIFKKGDPACCGNYRPISLLAVGYQILAAILLRRLKDAGAADRIWPTQFGFRSGCGCADALFIARRKVENAWARKNVSVFHVISNFFSVVRGIYNGSTSWCEMRVLASTPSDLAFLQVVLYPASCFRSS